MRENQFSHTPFKPPAQAAYVGVAISFISKMAPSLPESVRNRIAELTVAAMFGPERVSPDAIMADPVLSLCQSWCWPEANAALPFSLDYQGYAGQGAQLWRSEQWHAMFDADRLIREAKETKLDDWLYNMPMTQVREWRDNLLPSRPKKGRKFFLLLDLQRHPEFPAVVAHAYQGWLQGLLAEAETLVAEASKPPVPKHLSWLVKQVLSHLDNYNTATNSRHGPEAFAARLEQLSEAAREGVSPLDEPALQLELEETFSFLASLYGKDGTYTKIFQLVWGYIEQLRESLMPMAIARKLNAYAPGTLRCSAPCARCASKAPKKGRGVAPFDVLCTCNQFVWVPKTFKGSAHDWKFGLEVDMNATFWALDRLLGVNKASLDLTALAVRAQTSTWDDQYVRLVEPLLALGREKAAQYMRAPSVETYNPRR